MIYPWLEERFSSLAVRANSNSLHHALLLMGDLGIGKVSLAQHLAKKLLCETKDSAHPCERCKSCSLFEAGSHPDYYEIVSEKTQIGIDLIRQAIGNLNQTAQLSGNKVLVMPDADLMSESASNSLLKTLEEPTRNTYLIMTSSQGQKLLATILSRCEKLKIAAPSFEQSVQWLHQDSDTSMPTADALKAFNGSPLLYKKSIEEGDKLNFTAFESLIKDMLSGQANVAKAATTWQSEPQRLVRWLGQYFFKQFQAKNNELTLQAYNDCVSANKQLSHPGINKNLLISTLLNKVTGA